MQLWAEKWSIKIHVVFGVNNVLCRWKLCLRNAKQANIKNRYIIDSSIIIQIVEAINKFRDWRQKRELRTKCASDLFNELINSCGENVRMPSLWTFRIYDAVCASLQDVQWCIVKIDDVIWYLIVKHHSHYWALCASVFWFEIQIQIIYWQKIFIHAQSSFCSFSSSERQAFSTLLQIFQFYFQFCLHRFIANLS